MDLCKNPEGRRNPPTAEAESGAEGIERPNTVSSVDRASCACAEALSPVKVDDLDLPLTKGPVDFDKNPESERGRLCFFTIIVFADSKLLFAGRGPA